MSRGPPPRLWFTCPPAAIAIWIADTIKPLVGPDESHEQRRGYDRDHVDQNGVHQQDGSPDADHRQRPHDRLVLPVDEAVQDKFAVDLEEHR